MQGIGRMQEGRRSTGTVQRGDGLAGYIRTLSYTGEDHFTSPPGASQNIHDCLLEPLVQPGFKPADGLRLGTDGFPRSLEPIGGIG